MLRIAIVKLKLECVSESTGGLVKTQIADVQSLRLWFIRLYQSLRLYVVNNFPGDAAAASSETLPWELLFYSIVIYAV